MLDESFPCLGARSAIHTGRVHMASYGRLGDADLAQLQSLCDALATFSAAYPDPGEAPVTCIALFDDDVQGEQVADLFAFKDGEPACSLSSGRSIDYASKIYLSTGDVL